MWQRGVAGVVWYFWHHWFIVPRWCLTPAWLCKQSWVNWVTAENRMKLNLIQARDLITKLSDVWLDLSKSDPRKLQTDQKNDFHRRFPLLLRNLENSNLNHKVWLQTEEIFSVTIYVICISILLAACLLMSEMTRLYSWGNVATAFVVLDNFSSASQYSNILTNLLKG